MTLLSTQMAMPQAFAQSPTATSGFMEHCYVSDREYDVAFTNAKQRLEDAVTPFLQQFKIRGLGSSTLHLAYVGIGLLDGLLDHNVRVWDIAAAHAIALGGGAEVHYLRNNPFPLRQFDLHMPRIHYIAGNGKVCARIRKLLRAGAANPTPGKAGAARGR